MSTIIGPFGTVTVNLAVGDSVPGGAANMLLYVDVGGNLANGGTFDGSALTAQTIGVNNGSLRITGDGISDQSRIRFQDNTVGGQYWELRYDGANNMVRWNSSGTEGPILANGNFGVVDAHVGGALSLGYDMGTPAGLPQPVPGAIDVATGTFLRLVADAFLPPLHTTTFRNGLAATEGLTLYNTNTHSWEYYNGTVWGALGGANTALSNLSSPTSLNQSLLFQASLDIGDISYAAGPNRVFAQSFCHAGSSGSHFARILNAEFGPGPTFLPGVEIRTGGVTLGMGLDSSDKTLTLGMIDWSSPTHKFAGDPASGFALKLGIGASSGMHLFWGTDGSGDVGAAAATRPNSVYAKARVGVGLAGAQNASAIMQADSTTQGFLPPRLTTTQKNAVGSPATGLVVFDTTLAKLCVFTGATWETVTSA